MMTGALTLAALAPLAAVSGGAQAQAAAPAATRSPKPEPGDSLAFMIGPKAGKEVKPADIEVGKPPVLGKV